MFLLNSLRIIHANGPINGTLKNLLKWKLYSKPVCAYIGTTNAQNKEFKDVVIPVYIAPLANQIRGVKWFSLLTSISGLFAQPVILQRANELEASVPVIVGLCSFVGFFTFVTPLLLHYITKKYVTSIVYDPNTNSYIATTYTLLVRKKELAFKPGEAIVPEVPGMFTSVTIRGTPLFMDARFFDDLEHYKKIMGYDKPMDFKLKQTS